MRMAGPLSDHREPGRGMPMRCGAEGEGGEGRRS